jgi:hypothetical protein
MEDRDPDDDTTPQLLTTAAAGQSEDEEDGVSNDGLLRPPDSSQPFFSNLVLKAKDKVGKMMGGGTIGPRIKTADDRCGECRRCRQPTPCSSRPKERCGNCQQKRTCFFKLPCVTWGNRDSKLFTEDLAQRRAKYESKLKKQMSQTYDHNKSLKKGQATGLNLTQSLEPSHTALHGDELSQPQQQAPAQLPQPGLTPNPLGGAMALLPPLSQSNPEYNPQFTSGFLDNFLRDRRQEHIRDILGGAPTGGTTQPRPVTKPPGLAANFQPRNQQPAPFAPAPPGQHAPPIDNSGAAAAIRLDPMAARTSLPGSPSPDDEFRSEMRDQMNRFRDVENEKTHNLTQSIDALRGLIEQSASIQTNQAREMHDLKIQLAKSEMEKGKGAKTPAPRAETPAPRQKPPRQERDTRTSAYFPHAWYDNWLSHNPPPDDFPDSTDYNPDTLKLYKEMLAEKLEEERANQTAHEGKHNKSMFSQNGLQLNERPRQQRDQPSDFFDQIGAASKTGHWGNFQGPPHPDRERIETSTPSHFRPPRVNQPASSTMSSRDTSPVSRHSGADPVNQMTELTKAMVLIAKNSQSKPGTRSPPWQFSRMEVGPENKPTALGYHLFKTRVQQTIERLNIQEEIALNVLQSDGRVLPNKYRLQLAHCDTLEQVWRRLDEIFPHVETSKMEIMDSLVRRPHCANTPEAYVTHCDALLSALELKIRIHKQHFMDRTETMAVIGGMTGLDVSSIMERVDTATDRGESYERILYDFLHRTRKSKLDMMIAAGLYKPGKTPVVSHLGYSGQEKPPRQQGKMGKKPPRQDQTPVPQTTPAPQTTEGKVCVFCGQMGHSIRACQLIWDIRVGKGTLPKNRCPRCLYLIHPGVPHKPDCHMFFSNKLNKKRSLLCGLPAHKAYEQNYKICRGCGEDEKALSLLVKVTNKN